MLHRPLAALVLACALAFAMPVEAGTLLDAIVRVESGGNPNLTGRHGEIGLGQIQLQTARGLGYRGSRRQLYDPTTNLRWAAAYLGEALKRAGGDRCRAASLYNAGIFSRPKCSPYGRAVIRVMGQ